MSKENENSIFIGARTLKKEEVKIIVPTFDSIINRVEDIRREASNRSNNRVNNSDEHIKKYNNTITLFGERGTGKTSTMYTVRKELKKNEKDIFLEIIEPDSIGEEGKIMGCILGLFKDEIDKLQNDIKQKGPQNVSDKIKKDFFEDCRFKENNPIKKAYNDVLEYYCYTEKDYKKLLTCNYNDMNSYIKKSSHVFNADIEFGKKFEDFISKFIEYKKKHNCNEKKIDNNESNEPLIFIFIDDVDLNTNKCQEIIEAILRYASHANIICFITADYETFTDAFTISLLKQENLKEANLWPSIKINTENTILQRKQVLANEYMKKVFPPAYRHYVNTWDLSLIPKYSFGIEGNENRKDLFKLLSEISEARKIENIFGYYSEDENKGIYYLPAYNMFDKTSRGLVNVYYSLLNINNDLKKYNEERYFVDVKSFIENIINSSNIFAKYTEEIKKKYILWGANEEQSKIDFEQLQNLFEDVYKVDKQENITKDPKHIEIKYSVFYICYYVSILLPNIQYSKEKRKNVLKRSMLELVSNPRLNGYDISIKCSPYVKEYFSNNDDSYRDYYYNFNYRYNTYFRGFICDVLAESKLYFGQKFYNKIVNSNLIGFEVFDEVYEISEEKYNLLYLIFYKSLYNDIDKDIDILFDFYNNKILNKHVDFLEMKSNEDTELAYIEVIFKEVFEEFNEKIDEQMIKIVKNDNHGKIIKKFQEDFLAILKLEFKNIYDNKAIISNNFITDIKGIMVRYKDISETLNSEYKELKNNSDKASEMEKKELEERKKELQLIRAIYKTHQNEIEKENETYNQKENKYKDAKVFEGITKLMREIFGYELADIFFESINSINIDLPKFSTSDNGRIFKFDLSNEKINEKISKLLGTNSGSINTLASLAKVEISNIIDEIISAGEIKSAKLLADIKQYSDLKNKLNNLYIGNGRYCKDEAKELLDSLTNNVKIKIDNESMLNENNKWIIEAYGLFIQRNKAEVIEISELENAKRHFKDLLPKARERYEAKEKEYLEILGIQHDDEL